MKVKRVITILGVGAALAVTGGLAAPVIGGAIGGVMGLSGAAATSAGLAALGGGAVAAGGGGMAGGVALIQAVAGGVGLVGAKIAFTATDAAKRKKENIELREALKMNQVDEATKQKVIVQLNMRIDELKKALQEERKKNNKNEEKIKNLKELIDEYSETIKVAKMN